MVTKPPFRADQVGSLLRPPELREARAKAKAGALTAAQLKDVEDRCIRAAVARQESLGLRAVTDGEYRRDFWHLDFMAQLEGVGMAAPGGCPYLQLDDVTWACLCDGKVRDNFRANGDDPATLPGAYVALVNGALANRPAGMTVTMHTCRGNFRSTWFAAGGYADGVVEAMFSTNVDGYFMEWDTGRAGGFEPLRLLPRDKKVVLGLVTTKSGALESKDALRRRIDEAAKYVPLERLGLSPQCGFASTHHGNTLTEDEQWKN